MRLTISVLQIFLLTRLSILHRIPQLTKAKPLLIEQPQASNTKSWGDYIEDLLVIVPYLRPKGPEIWFLIYIVGIIQVLNRPLVILPLISVGALLTTLKPFGVCIYTIF